MANKYRANEIANYLITTYKVAPSAALRASKEIAQRWNDHEFWYSATFNALAPLGLNSKPVVRALELRFKVYVHDCPAWEPKFSSSSSQRR